MKTLEELYISAQTALTEYKSQLEGYVKDVREVTEAEINLDSIRALITSQHEHSGVSKTALKELVAGNADVMNAKKTLMKKEANLAVRKENLKYLDMVYSLDKKAMSCLNEEQKYFGG